MVTGVAVLGVIRAARPTFRSAHDRVAFAVHASLLAGGYSLTAVGSAVASSAPGSGSEEAEVGIEGWNELEGAYAFQYSGGNQAGLCKSLIVKCTAMGDLLMVDAASVSTADTPANLEIKVTDYAVERVGNNYGEQFSNLEGLVERVNSSIVGKLLPAASSTSYENAQASERGREREREGEARQPRVSILEDPPRSPGFGYPEIPSYGGNDLLPGAGGGIFAPRRDIDVGGGSMLVGPGDPRWGRVGVGPGGAPNPLGLPPGVPPGARFDPFGPIPGFEPGRGSRRGPPGGSHPDLEHFSPF